MMDLFPAMWFGSEGKFLVFLPLVAVNEHGKLEGVLAQSWEHSEDYLIWTIRVRDNIHWHDGVTFTAHDVEFTINLLQYLSQDHPEFSPGWGWHPIPSVTVHDESTFTLTFEKVPFHALYWMPGYWDVFYPKHLLEGLDPDEFQTWEFWKSPVGNGPYRLIRFVPEIGIEFEANPDYFRGKPKIERIVIRSGSIQDLLAGRGDVIDLIGGSDVQFLLEDVRFELYHEFWVDIGWMSVVLWNQRNPILADRRIRRALTLAIDRSTLPHIMIRPPGVRIVDAPYTHRQYLQDDLPEPLPYNPEEAERLLGEAGWQDVDGDGIRELTADKIEGNDIKELEFSFLTWPDYNYERGAVFLQSQWRRVGVKAEILTLDSSILRNRVKAGNFDAAFTGIINEPLGWGGLLRYFGRESPVGYANSRVISLLEEARETTHPDRIDTIYRELAPIFLRDLPYTFISAGSESFIAHRRLKGLSTPYRANPIWAMEHLWIEEEK